MTMVDVPCKEERECNPRSAVAKSDSRLTLPLSANLPTLWLFILGWLLLNSRPTFAMAFGLGRTNAFSTFCSGFRLVFIIVRFFQRMQ